MAKRGIEGDTAQDIVVNMETSIREITGFAKLEDDRVRAMTNNIKSNLDKSKILVIVELSNADFLIKSLKES